MSALLAILLPLIASQIPAPVAPVPARSEKVVLARIEFRKGNFREAIDKLEEAKRSNELQDPNDRFEASLLMGLSHIYLADPAGAMPHFQDVLLANPDFDLDPLTYGEVAKRELDAARSSPDLQDRLARRRQEIREAKLRDEEVRRLAEEADRRRRELAAIPEQVPAIERHSPILLFLPFGVPQIEQERITPGVLFAMAQAISLTVTVFTYTQVQLLIESDGRVAHDNMTRARNWRTGNWISVGVTAGVYIGGVVDAFVHYRERTTSTLPRDEYLKLRPLNPPASAASPKPSADLLVVPIPGGAAACLSGHF